MVGLCGILGDPQHDIDSISDTIEWSDDEQTAVYTDDTAQIYAAVHDEADATQPETIRDGDRLLWIWGDVIGFEDSTGYKPRRDDSGGDPTYCGELLDSHGLSFVDGLNSEFAGLVIDREQRTATLFTDRLGARPIYLTEAVEGSVIFSTSPNTILAHPAFEPAVDDELLSEFLKFERVFGTHTPFEGISQLHPGSKLTLDLEDGTTSIERYWQPRYRPTEKPYDSFVEEFETIIRNAVDERRDESADEGLFISGGSDSRLLLSLFEDRNVTGYHINDTMNTEATIAREACDTAGVDFRFLQREPDYLTDVLERVADFQILSSFFDQAHFAGFEAELNEEVDAVFCGHTADTILEGFYLPTREPFVPGLGWTIPLPLVDPVESVEEYRDYILESYQYNRGSSANTQPAYLTLEADPTEVLGKRMTESGGTIVHHGVTYPSLQSLAHAGGFYPLTNNKAYFAYYSLTQMMPTHYPFLDNRVIDFSLSVPHRYHTRKSVVNRTLTKRNRELAKIPKSGMGLPLTYPRTVYSVAQLWRSFRSKFGSDSESNGGSWSDHDRVLRETDLADKHLLDRENPERCPEIVDWGAVEALYRAHLNGENNYFDLYAILSLCNSYPARNGHLTEQ